MKFIVVALAALALVSAMPADIAEGTNILYNQQDNLQFPNIEPGLQGGINTAGLNAIVNYAVRRAIAQIKDATFPGDSGKDSGFNWGVSNIHMKRVDLNSVASRVENGIYVGVDGLSVALGLNWNYKLHKWPHLPKGSGTADVSIDASTIGANFVINAVQTPYGLKPQVRASATVSLNNVNIKTHGSMFSWLYNLIIKIFKNKIRTTIEETIRVGFVTAINTLSDQILATMPTYAPISKWGTLDFGIVQNAAYLVPNQEIMLAFNGEVYPMSTNRTDGIVPRSGMNFVPSGRHLDVNFNLFVLNSAAHSWMQMGGLNKVINDGNRPAGFPIALNAGAWALLIPSLQAAYPNAPLQVTITCANRPEFSSASGKFSLGGSFVADVAAQTASGFKSAFKIGSTMSSTLSLQLENRAGTPYFVPQIAQTSLAANLISSTIGDIKVKEVAYIIDAAMNLFVIPSINRDLLNGFPIPSVQGIGFHNPVFNINNNYISFSADLTFAA